MNRKIQFDASSLALESGGSGDPALFVHGFGSSKSDWRRVCGGVGDVFSFYAIDLPGFGETPAPGRFRYTLENFADVLTEFVTIRDFKKLTMVGTSLGASIILLAVLRNRVELATRLRSLCLIDAIVYPRHFSYLIETLQTSIALAPLFGFLATDFLWPERRRIRDAMVETVRQVDVERFAHYLPRLKTIDLPTLVIWGREDDLVPLRFGKRLARDLPNARLVVIDDCGHAPHRQRPGKVIAALKKFSQEIGDKTAQRG
jgi:pimeloyl-ACP methyl ester carboxylesterase